MRDKVEFIEKYEKYTKDQYNGDQRFWVKISKWYKQVFGRRTRGGVFSEYKEPFDFVFDIDTEDLETLYNKYKPQVEEWKCKETEKEIAAKKERIEKEKQELLKLEQKRCL